VQPTDLNATISATGILTLSFRAPNSGQGTTFLIRRKLATESNFSFIGTATGTRSVIKTFGTSDLCPLHGLRLMPGV
jgi:hypothetical protein